MNEAIYNALCACFALQPTSDAASVLIRAAYQEPENVPRPPRSTDVIYYSVAPYSAAEPPPAYTADNSATSIVATPSHGDRSFRLTSALPNNPPLAVDSASPIPATHTPSVSLFSAWQLQVVCYGPHALENARKVRAFLFLDGSGFPRSILRKAGIRLVPDPPEPTLLHEPEGSLWRERADLTVQLHAEEKETHPGRRGAVRSVPAVILHR